LISLSGSALAVVGGCAAGLFRFFLEAIGEAALPAGFVYLRDVDPRIALAATFIAYTNPQAAAECTAEHLRERRGEIITPSNTDTTRRSHCRASKDFRLIARDEGTCEHVQ
jgi:hypothetical protein